jgi:ABC-type phosphate transport system permease subunit
MNSLTSTTSSAMALNQVVICAVVATGALIILLVLNELQSNSWNAHTVATRRLQMIAAFVPEWRDSFNANRLGALQIISAPLIVTFVAFVAFKVALVLK